MESALGKEIDFILNSVAEEEKTQFLNCHPFGVLISRTRSHGKDVHEGSGSNGVNLMGFNFWNKIT